MRKVTIGSRMVGDGEPTFVIAEVGINHNGDMKLAEQLLREAKAAGADAAKLQTYTTEKRVQKDSPIFDILKRCELSFDQQRELFELGEELDLIVFSTPFDEESVSFLEDVGSPCIKIASFDVANEQLLVKAATSGRPVILSRGMATGEELDRAVAIFHENDTPHVLLHCVSSYPVGSPKDLNLSTISAMKQTYSCPIGFSDHSVGTMAAAVAVAAGAQIVEKHFTLADTVDAADYVLSADPTTLKTMIEEIRQVEEALGVPTFQPIEAERGAFQFRRFTKIQNG